MLHQRIEFFSEFYCKFADALTRLVDACLNGIVEDGILVGGRSAVMERLCRLAQLPFEEVQVAAQIRQYGTYPRSIQSEVLEQRRENGKSLVLAQTVKGFEKHHHALRSGLVQCFDEGVGLQTYFLRHLSRFFEQFHYGTLQGSCRHLHLLTVSVQSGGESHNFGNCHFCRRADASHSLSKFHDEGLGGGTVLREVVDRRADFEHCVPDAIHLLHAEDIG